MKISGIHRAGDTRSELVRAQSMFVRKQDVARDIFAYLLQCSRPLGSGLDCRIQLGCMEGVEQTY